MPGKNNNTRLTDGSILIDFYEEFIVHSIIIQKLSLKEKFAQLKGFICLLRFISRVSSGDEGSSTTVTFPYASPRIVFLGWGYSSADLSFLV